MDRSVIQQVQREFLEMPGLRLTLPQAQRLWNLEATTCERVLRHLIDLKFLARTLDGLYVRSSFGAPSVVSKPAA